MIFFLEFFLLVTLKNESEERGDADREEETARLCDTDRKTDGPPRIFFVNFFPCHQKKTKTRRTRRERRERACACA